jgi:MFS-type transporter involved in bile tolerance (Atg22 family)
MLTYSYLPEISNDEEKMNRYTRNFTVISFSGMVIFLAAIVGVTAAVGLSEDKTTLDEEIGTARLSQSVTTFINVVLLSIAWGLLFEKRPPARERQTDDGHFSLLTAGYKHLRNTIPRVYRNYPSLRWYYVSVAFSDAAEHALTILGVTFLTDTLQFSARENGTTILIMLLGSIPGGFCAHYFTKRFNPIYSAMTAISISIINVACVASFIQPGHTTEAYVCAIFWGIGQGWKWTSDKMILARILPEGQNAELMGLWVFFKQILVWLPPLVFTILNEAGVSQRIGFGSLCVFFAIGLFCLSRVGSYSAAVENAHPGQREDAEESPPNGGGTEPHPSQIAGVDESLHTCNMQCRRN